MPGLDVRRFEAFVRAHQDMVFAVSVRLLGDAAEAEDVSQSVFLKAWQRFAALETSEAAAGWLRTVARNACLNHLTRHRQRYRLFSEMDSRGAGEPTFEAQLPAVAPDAADEARAEQAADLEQALRQLPAHQRVPLVLFHFEAQSYQDIASALGVSVGKIKTDIHRGRETLKRQLGAGRHA